MKNFIIKSISATVLCALFVACGDNQGPKEKYCGVEMSSFQAMELKKTGNAGYIFSDDDKKLASDIIDELNALYNNEHKFNLGFIERDSNKISLYVIVPDDQAVIEKVSCHLLQNDFDGRLPETRNLLFYTSAYDKLLIGIKSKK